MCSWVRSGCQSCVHDALMVVLHQCMTVAVQGMCHWESPQCWTILGKSTGNVKWVISKPFTFSSFI
jgi:hypothetical protein